MNKMDSDSLKLARRNTAWLLAFLYLQEIFWFSLSRTSLIERRFYNITPFDWHYFLLLICLALIFALVSVGFCQIMRPLPKIRIPRISIRLILILVIFLNALSVILVNPNARYAGGDFTALSWAIYVLSNSLTLATVMLIIRENDSGDRISYQWIIALLLSYAATIDGMASALTLFMFGFLLFDFGKLSLKKVLLASAFAAVLFTAGFQAKFDTTPDYVTPEFIAQWAIARFSIQAEQMYTYVSNDSIINNQISYLDLVSRDFTYRFGRATGFSVTQEHPASVSEATRFDMHGNYSNAGSSPGILLGTVFLGPFFIIPPLFLSFLFIQHFYGLKKNISIPDLVAYSFALKVLHTSFSSYFTILSPTFIGGAVFITSSLICSKRYLN